MDLLNCPMAGPPLLWVSHTHSGSSKVKTPTLSSKPEGVHWKLNSPLLCPITSPLPTHDVRAKEPNNNSVTSQLADPAGPHENLREAGYAHMFVELREQCLAPSINFTCQRCTGVLISQFAVPAFQIDAPRGMQTTVQSVITRECGGACVLL